MKGTNSNDNEWWIDKINKNILILWIENMIV